MKKILIVEDELPYLKLLRDQLIQNGYEVFEAIDGQEGLDKARLHAPDLILLDIKMPVMDGLIMLEELRKTTKGKKTKVIVLTNLELNDRILKKVLSDKPELYLIKSDIKLLGLIAQIKTSLNSL